MSDDDKTVFGQQLPPRKAGGGQKPAPTPGPAPEPPAAAPVPPAPRPPPPADAERTVFGVPLGQAGLGPRPADGRIAPTAPQQPAPPAFQPPPTYAPGHDDTWLGGAFTPGGAAQPPQHQPPHYQTPQYQAPQYQAPQYRPESVPTGADMFPDIPRPQAEVAPQVTPRIALEDALRGTGADAGGSSNPLIRAAANLLILLGRLRTGLVEMQSGPLIEHVAREIDQFERNALAAGVSPMDASDAKYALSATADDIVQNLPGADRGTWLQYSMIARFFNERSSGIGFFRKMDDAMKAPGQRFNLLELMLTCLSLGFEGQYRTMPNGGVELSRIRQAMHETLRRVQPRPDDDISVIWQAVPMRAGRRYGGTPLWVIASVAAAMVVALFATLSTLLSYRGTEVEGQVAALHAGLPTIVIERQVQQAAFVPFVPPENTQLMRIRAGLAEALEAGRVGVEEQGNFIMIRVGDSLQFASGSAELAADFTALAQEIVTVIDTEPGPIRVVGYTDSIPPSGRGRYRTNEALSLARAETVSGILAGMMTDPARITVEGLGPLNPIADNETPEGRARNRRVEVMIAREGTY